MSSLHAAGIVPAATESERCAKVEVLSFTADVMLGECEDEDMTRRSTRGLKMLVLSFGEM